MEKKYLDFTKFRITLVLIGLLSPLISCSPASAKQVPLDYFLSGFPEFKGLAFGMTVSEVQALRPNIQRDDLFYLEADRDMYVEVQRNGSIRDSEIEAVAYYFIDGYLKGMLLEINQDNGNYREKLEKYILRLYEEYSEPDHKGYMAYIRLRQEDFKQSLIGLTARRFETEDNRIYPYIEWQFNEMTINFKFLSPAYDIQTNRDVTSSHRVIQFSCFINEPETREIVFWLQKDTQNVPDFIKKDTEALFHQ